MKPVIVNLGWGVVAWAKASRGEQRPSSATKASERTRRLPMPLPLDAIRACEAIRSPGETCRARRHYQNVAKTSNFPVFDLPLLRLAGSPKGPIPAARGLQDHETRWTRPSHVSVPSPHCSLPESGRV